MSETPDSYAQMLAMVQAFHDKHDFKSRGGEDMLFRVALMSEELGEISACVTKGKGPDKLSEELADLFILVLGTAISARVDLPAAFAEKMEELMKRPARDVGGRVRVSRFEGQ